MTFVLNKLALLKKRDTLNRFFGRFDLSKVGVAGHSLGGATALQFCHDDERCVAGVDMDGAPLGQVITKGIKQPFLFLMTDQINRSDSESREVKYNVASISKQRSSENKQVVVLNGAGHFLFSDDGAYLKSPALMSLLRFIGVVGLEGNAQLEETSQQLLIFFDKSLRSRT